MVLTLLPGVAFATPVADDVYVGSDGYLPIDDEYDDADVAADYELDTLVSALDESIGVAGFAEDFGYYAPGHPDEYERGGYTLNEIRAMLQAGEASGFERVYRPDGSTATYSILEEDLLEIFGEPVPDYGIQALNNFTYAVRPILGEGRLCSESIVLVLLGDGFTPGNEYGQVGYYQNPGEGTFLYSAHEFAETITSMYPFRLFSDIFKIYAVETPSTHQGIQVGNAPHPGTYFGSYLIADFDIQMMRTAHALDISNWISPNAIMTQVIANIRRPAGRAFSVGAGYENNHSVGISTRYLGFYFPGYGHINYIPGWDRPAYHHIIVHEIGHNFGRLSDEHANINPVLGRANVARATDTDEQLRWGHWLGHAGITRRVQQAPAGYIFPSTNNTCLMQGATGGGSFCAVCRAELTRRMAMISGETFEAGRRPDGTIRPARPNVTVTSQHNRILPYAFHGNTSLETITISDSVTEIGDFAFIGASGLETIVSHSTVPQQINDTTFAGLNRGNIDVMIPCGTTQTYIDAGWGGFNLIEFSSISLTPSGDHIFPAAVAGYDTQVAHSVTAENTGSQATGVITVTLSGENADSFTLNRTTIPSLPPGGSDNFTIAPIAGLAPGLYTATVTISDGVDLTAQTFTVRFAVLIMNHGELEAAIAAAPTDRTEVSLFLGTSFTMDNQLRIEYGRQIRLSSYPESHVLTTAVMSPDPQRHFVVSGDGSHLTLDHIELDGVWTPDSIDASTPRGGIEVENGASFTMNEGSIIRRCWWNSSADSEIQILRGSGVHIRDIGSTFNMTGGSIAENKVADFDGIVFIAGGVLVSDHGRFEMTGGSITDNKVADFPAFSANTAGGVLVIDGGHFAMTGGTISNNHDMRRSNGAGGVQTHRGNANFTMTGGSITGNTAEGTLSAGGVRVGTVADFYMRYGTISGNTSRGSESAGGIGIYSAGGFRWVELSINSAINPGNSNWAIVENNTAEGSMSAGGINIQNGGQLRTLDNAGIRNNTATGTASSGGVRVGNGTFDMLGSMITGNEGAQGGGIHIAADSRFIAQGIIGTINRNEAQYGGGVWVAESGVLEVRSPQGIFFQDNKATHDGGAIFTECEDYANIMLYRTEFINNSASRSFLPPTYALDRIPAADFLSTSIHNHPLNNYDINFRGVEHAVTWELYGGTWPVGATYQTAVTHNGTINAPAGNPTRVGYDFSGWNVTFPITNVTAITTITALWTAASDTLVHTWDELRTAVNAVPANVSTTIRIAGDLTTTATANPNVITIPANRNIILESSETSTNRNIDMLTATSRHFTVSGQLTLGNGITLRGGADATNANNAGGVLVTSGGTLIMLDNSVIQWINRTGVHAADFGAVNLSSTVAATRATFIMEGGTIQNNSTNTGGGVSVSANGYFVMRGGTISENSGSGVRVSTGSSIFIMEGGTIQNNVANRGGGVGVGGGNFTMEGGTISGNQATEWGRGGGGVNVSWHGTFTMTGGTISHNTALSGGGVRVEEGSSFIMDGASARIEYNTATDTGARGGGGGVIIGGGIISPAFGTPTAYLISGEISNNTAPTGGGVLIDANSVFTMTGGTIRSNTAGQGGGLYISGSGSGISTSFTMNGTAARIEDNSATELVGGGGIFQNRGRVNIIAGEINNNTAPNGGGVRVSALVSADAFTMTGGALRNNNATAGDGGAIFTGASTLTATSLPLNSLPMLIIYNGVIFEDNIAFAGWATPPVNATTATRVLATSSSIIGINHPLNNFDINFRGGGLTPWQ